MVLKPNHYLTICVGIALIFAVPAATFSTISERAIKATVFYVAVNGNDKWSGILSAPNASETDGPFATLQKARDAIRELKKKGSKDSFSVVVRGGRYELKETLVLGPEDSGTEFQPLVFRAFENETPILSGSRRVSGFEPHKGKIYKTSLSGLVNEFDLPRQLFARGNRQILARYPNFDKLNPIGGGFLYVADIVEEGSKKKFKYHANDIKEWPSIEGAEVVIYPGHNWGGGAQTILSIDRTSQIITLAQDATREFLAGNRYYFQNLIEELDSPGEWYYDRRQKTLYYWPQNEADLELLTIPVLKSIVDIRGKKLGDKYYGTPSYIRLEGFELEGCEGSAVVIRDAKKTVIARNIIHNAGGNGIEIYNGFENVAVGNDIYSIGGTGIIISGDVHKTLTPANNRAENNYVHNTGVFIKGGASGILCKGVGNIVSHNLIHSMPRVGIWFDGNDHLIEYNHIHHVNQETQDSGIIYSSQIDWTKRGNIIRYNYLHDSGGYGRNKATEPWQAPFETYGIYMDDWTSGTEVYGNVIKNTANGGIFIHGGRDNIVQNNIIIEGGRLGQMVYSAWLPTNPVAQKLLPVMFAKVREMGLTKYPRLSTIKDVGTGAKMSGNSFTRNIVYYRDKNAPLYGIHNDIDITTTVSDYNVIYHAGLPLLIPYMKTQSDKQWTEWQKKGLDTHSLIADPLFCNIKEGDFTVSSTSPALNIGFKQIPFEKIGPYKDPMRATWPINKLN